MTVQNPTQNTDRVRPPQAQGNRDEGPMISNDRLMRMKGGLKRQSKRAKEREIAQMQEAARLGRIEKRIGYDERLTHRTDPIIEILDQRCDDANNGCFDGVIAAEKPHFKDYSFDALQTTLYMLGNDEHHERRREALLKLIKSGDWRSYSDRKKRATYVMMTYFKEINLHENIPRRKKWNSYSEDQAVEECKKLIAKARQQLEGKKSSSDNKVRAQYEEALKFLKVNNTPRAEVIDGDLELAKQRKAHESDNEEEYQSSTVALSTADILENPNKIMSDQWYQVNRTIAMVEDDNFDEKRNPDALLKAFFKLNDGDKVRLLKDLSKTPDLYKKYIGSIHDKLQKNITDAFSDNNKGKMQDNLSKMMKLIFATKPSWDEKEKGSLCLAEPADILINLVGNKYKNSHLERALKYSTESEALKESVQDMLANAKKGIHFDIEAERDFDDASGQENAIHKKMAMHALSNCTEKEIKHIFDMAAMVSDIYNMSEGREDTPARYPNSIEYLHGLCEDFDDKLLHEMSEDEREKVLKVKKISAKYTHDFDKSFFKKSQQEQQHYLKRLTDHPTNYKNFMRLAYDDHAKKMKSSFEKGDYKKMDKYVGQLKHLFSASQNINADLHDQQDLIAPHDILSGYMSEKHSMPNITHLLHHAPDSDALFMLLNDGTRSHDPAPDDFNKDSYNIRNPFFSPKQTEGDAHIYGDAAQKVDKIERDAFSKFYMQNTMHDLCKLNDDELKEFFEVALVLSKNAYPDNKAHSLSHIESVCQFFDESTLETASIGKREKITKVKRLLEDYLRKSGLHHVPDEKRAKRLIEYQFNFLAMAREKTIATGVNQLACDRPNPEDIDNMVKALLNVNATERKGIIQRIAIKSGDKIYLKLMKAVQNNINENYDPNNPKATLDVKSHNMLATIGQVYKTLEEEKPLGTETTMQYPIEMVMKHLAKKYFPKDSQEFTCSNFLKTSHGNQKAVMRSLKIMTDHAFNTASYKDIEKINTISAQFMEDLNSEQSKGAITEKEAGRLQKMIADNLRTDTDIDANPFDNIDVIIDRDSLMNSEKEREVIDNEVVTSTMISSGKMFINSLLAGVEEGVDAEDKIDAMIKSGITAASFKMIDDVHAAMHPSDHLTLYPQQHYSNWIDGVNKNYLDLGLSPATLSDQAIQIGCAAFLGLALKTARDVLKDHNNVPDIKKLNIDDTAWKNIAKHALSFGSFAVANGITGATFHLPNAIKSGWDLGHGHTLGEVASEITRKAGQEGVTRGSMIVAAEMLHTVMGLASKTTAIHWGWGLAGMAVATPAMAVGMSASGCAIIMGAAAGARKLTDMAKERHRENRRDYKRYLNPQLTGDISEKSMADAYRRLAQQNLESSMSGQPEETEEKKAEEPKDSGVEEKKESAA